MHVSFSTEAMSYRWSVFGWPLEGVPKTDQINLRSSDPAAGTVYTRCTPCLLVCRKLLIYKLDALLG